MTLTVINIAMGLKAAWMDFARDDGGATAIEYGLLAAAMGIVAGVAITLYADELGELFLAIRDRATGAL